jgi:hypothetical protein
MKSYLMCASLAALSVHSLSHSATVFHNTTMPANAELLPLVYDELQRLARPLPRMESRRSSVT